MPKRIRKAVLPVAGVGTRFLPATKAIPKELLPIVDKPVLQFLVEEAVSAGIEEIIFVVSAGKEAIRTHFSSASTLERLLAERKKNDLLKLIKKIPKLARFRYVTQREPLGDGHAILQARKFVGNEPFLVLFGDDIVRGKISVAEQLKKVYARTGNAVIALQKVPRAEVNRYGVVKIEHSALSTQHTDRENSAHEGRRTKNEELITISGFVEKPTPKEAPSDLAIVGKYICPPEIFPILAAHPNASGEIRLIDAFSELLRQQKIQGLIFEGERFDTGDKFGFVKATLAFALCHPEIGKQTQAYLKKLA